MPARPTAQPPIAGDVIGFALAWEGQAHGALWLTGDTVLYDGLRQVADRLQVGTALLHLGCVRFPVTGPVRYSIRFRAGRPLGRWLSRTSGAASTGASGGWPPTCLGRGDD